MSSGFLILATFLACAVEAVEALTIVLAVGTTRGWRSTLYGTGAAALLLVAVVVVLGPALSSVPLDSLRTVIGTLLLLFGLQWLRKAILRASGTMAERNEAAEFARQRDAAGRVSPTGGAGIDWYAFTLAFKSVLLEGLEVVFIVVTFGAAQHRIGLAAVTAAVTVALVAAAGALVRGPLARVPENTLKFAVGVLLSAFGIFWVAEGLGASWPASDASLIAIALFVLGWSLVLVRALQRHARQFASGPAPVPEPEPGT